MKKIKYLGLIVIMLIALTGCGEKKEETQKATILLKDNLKFEINSEVNLLSIISEDNKVKVLSEDETIDTSTLGEKEITIKYEVEEKEEEKTFKITIVDTEAPTIEYTKELSTNVGTKIDLLKNVKVSDNSKEEIKATIEGDYNFDNEGTYNLKYVAVDSSNNKTEEDFTLKVNKKPTTSNNTNTSNNSNNNNTSSNNCVSGKWSTSKPSGCEYTTKTLHWAYMLDYNNGGVGIWALEVNGIWYSPTDANFPSSYRQYLSIQPKGEPTDEVGEKYTTIYTIK